MNLDINFIAADHMNNPDGTSSVNLIVKNVPIEFNPIIQTQQPDFNEIIFGCWEIIREDDDYPSEKTILVEILTEEGFILYRMHVSWLLNLWNKKIEERLLREKIK